MVKRSIINMNLATSNNEYAYIDHIRGGSQFGGPGQAQWKTGTIWTQQIDANGWPAYSSTTRTAGICGLSVPASSDFAGPYTLDGVGSGRITISAGTWTLGASSGVTQVGNGSYDVVDSGSGWTMQLTYSGSAQIVGLNAPRIDPSATGAYLRNVRFYRTADAADLAAGKIFRAAWKQVLRDLNPSAIRVMNWHGNSNSKVCRFEHRTTPNYAQWQPSSYNWATGPAYGETTGTNQYSLSAVTGTPASMQHGEMAICRVGNAAVRVGAVTVSAITKANPGVVTATAHGFNTGDQIVHVISAGMTQLDYRPCTITVTDANTYSIGIDTTAFTTFTAGVAEQFITLQVGSGNDRTAYPVVFPDGIVTAGHYGTGYIAAGDYKTFYFDKTISGQRDSSGNLVLGAWIFNDTGADKGHQGGTPYEAASALINELMAMSRTDGGAIDPIDLWVCMPHRGLLSMDPDYSEGSNHAVGMVDVILNGSTINSVTYAGLDARCKLYVEFSNETWNTAGGFYASMYLRRAGFLRWPASGQTDVHSYTTLRSLVMVNDIVGAGFNRSRLKFILAGQGTIGASGGNTTRMNGSAYVLADASNVGGIVPMTVHDYFAWAAYFVIGGTWESSNLAAIVASWVSHAGDAVAQEADCASYVAGFENTGVSGNETVYRYRDVLLPAYASEMTSRGKQTIMYEGGWDRSVTNGTADQNSFFAAVKKSRAWANKLCGFFSRFDTTTDAIGPSDYIQFDQRWGHLYPNTYTDAVGGVEWSGIDLAWKLQALRNRGKRQMVIKT